MNYRKIIILPVLLILSHILYIGCCKCIDSKNHFYEITNTSVKLHGSNKSIIDTGLVTHVDTVYLEYSFYPNCVATTKNPFSFLVNESYACKCVECGNEGLKSKIVSIAITSDSIYNGVAANEPLNDFFKARYLSDTGISLDSLKNAVNNNPGTLFSVEVFITTKPANDKAHILTLRIVFADGREIVGPANKITWI